MPGSFQRGNSSTSQKNTLRVRSVDDPFGPGTRAVLTRRWLDCRLGVRFARNSVFYTGEHIVMEESARGGIKFRDHLGWLWDEGGRKPFRARLRGLRGLDIQ